MEHLMEIWNWVITQGPLFLSAVVGVLTALIVLFTYIPGDQPEKALQKAVDFIKSISKK